VIDKREAQLKVLAYLKTRSKWHELALQEDSTLETEFGWVFFYNSVEFVRTGDMHFALGGNAPFIIDRSSGELTVTGTALPLDHYIEQYRRNRSQA
jgi:hypothetical protein